MKFNKLALVLASLIALQGCMAAAVVSVVGGAVAVNDKRTLGRQLDDQTIELSALKKLTQDEAINNNTNIQVTSVNGAILVVGQAPTTHLRDQAIRLVSDIPGVQKVHNQIRIGNVTSIATRTNDVWLTSKVKTALLASDKLDATKIKVVTENGEVFLMGLIDKAEGAQAVEITRNLSGINRVYKAFEYL